MTPDGTPLAGRMPADSKDPGRADSNQLSTAVKDAPRRSPMLWQGLKPGAIMGVVDTPNRLWYFDDHTSNLPFFHWLPEEIALGYTARCDRDLIKDLYKLPASEGAIGLQRWGRGISYHDFELALDGLPPMKIAAAYGPHERARFLPKLIKWHVSVDYAFYKTLRRIARELDPAFCEPYLEFLAKKPN